jgi:hypothetical protein
MAVSRIVNCMGYGKNLLPNHFNAPSRNFLEGTENWLEGPQDWWSLGRDLYAGSSA